VYKSPNETTINGLLVERKALVRQARQETTPEGWQPILDKISTIDSQLEQYEEYADLDADEAFGVAYGLLAADVPDGEDPDLPDEPRQDAAIDNVPDEKLAELVIRSVYEGGENAPGGTKVMRVADVKVGTPPGGWSCTAVIDSPDGQDTLLVTWSPTEGYRDVVQGAGFEAKGDAAPVTLPKPQPL
jgi:hypothetical protein